MKAFINAYGLEDSLKQDRSREIRGLVPFAGRPLLHHTLDRFAEIGIEDPVLLYANRDHVDAYARACQDAPMDVDVRPYTGTPHPFVVYFEGLRVLDGDDVLMVADDNIFDFSLQGMVDRFYQVDSHVLAARPMRQITSGSNEEFNFGLCVRSPNGKVTAASCSFAPETKLEAPRVILDLYLMREGHVQQFYDQIQRGQDGIMELAQTWWHDFYVWEPKSGFWADIGKPALRAMAEEYFTNPAPPSQAVEKVDFG